MRKEGLWSVVGRSEEKKLFRLLIYLDFRNNNKPIYFYVHYVYYCLMYLYIWICYNQQHWLWINKIKRLSFITINFFTLLYPVRVTKRNWKAVSRLFVAVIICILMNLLLFIAVRIFQVVNFLSLRLLICWPRDWHVNAFFIFWCILRCLIKLYQKFFYSCVSGTEAYMRKWFLHTS